MSRDGAQRALEWLFAALALAYLLLLHQVPFPGHVALKALPILCLLAAVLHGRGQGYRQVVAALLCCAAGDVLLALGHFLFGLAAFLLGHLCYLAAFAREPRWSPGALAVLAALAVCIALLVLFLSPHLGDMRLPVYAYMLVIVAMTTAAILGRDNHVLVGVGAVLFLVSDALIAVNRFASPFDGSGYAIMASYYGAQFLLTRDARLSR